MGAATVILYCSENKEMDVAVADSAFSSLDMMIDHIAATEIGLPQCLVGYAKYRMNNYLLGTH